MTNNTQIEINLDKICAEYGMGLLNEFCSIKADDIDSIQFNELTNIVESFKYSDTERFDRDKIDNYKNELKNKLEQLKTSLLSSSCSISLKYLFITWYLPELAKKIYGRNSPNRIEKISDEKERIKKIVNFKFEFSPSTFETEITKALGILVEDGPFAYIIWLKSQDKEPHRAMLIQTARILQELKIINLISHEENLKDKIEEAFLDEISSDLTKTLLVKTVIEKMLIYARYKAKAMQHE